MKIYLHSVPKVTLPFLCTFSTSRREMFSLLESYGLKAFVWQSRLSITSMQGPKTNRLIVYLIKLGYKDPEEIVVVPRGHRSGKISPSDDDGLQIFDKRTRTERFPPSKPALPPNGVGSQVAPTLKSALEHSTLRADKLLRCQNQGGQVLCRFGSKVSIGLEMDGGLGMLRLWRRRLRLCALNIQQLSRINL